MSRLGRSQPVQPSAWHGFVDSGVGVPGTTPPAAQFVPLDQDRHHLRPALPPVAGQHGFVDSGVGVPGTVPSRTVSLDRPEHRVRWLPLAPTAVVGIPADQFAQAVVPPQPTVVPVRERPGFSVSTSTGVGFSDPGPGPVGTVPPDPVNVDRVDQRARYRPLDPITISGVLAGLTAPPTVAPRGPYVVPVEERRRFLAAIPPDVSVGFDDPDPPPPNVVEQDRRRRLPLDPFTATPGAAAAAPSAPVLPPGPYVVPVDARGRFIITLPATGQHGFVDPGPGPVGTTPPPVVNVDRVDQRVRYLPLKPLVGNGAYIAPTVFQTVTGYFGSQPKGVTGDRPQEGEFQNTPRGNIRTGPSEGSFD